MAIRAPRYTIADLDQFPVDGNRYELLDGALLVTPPPSVQHQVIASVIGNRILTELGADIVTVVTPGAIPRGSKTQLQPDLLAFPARFATAAAWTEIPDHWLAVEVLSRSSRVYDRDFKRDTYFALGVLEVWLVDARARTVEVSRKPRTPETVTDVIRWRVPGMDRVVTFDLSEVFRHVPR